MVREFWRSAVLPIYILRTKFSRMDGDDVYSVLAATPMTSFYEPTSNYAAICL